MNISLDKPAPGDIGWLISAHGAAYAEQFQFDRQFELDITRKVATFYQKVDDFNRVLISRIDGQRTGSVAVSRKSKQVAFINFLLVLEKYRGHGIAKRLFDNVIDHSGKHGCRIVRLETYSILTAARGMYRRYGFELVEVNEDVKMYGRVFDQEFWELKL